MCTVCGCDDHVLGEPSHDAHHSHHHAGHSHEGHPDSGALPPDHGAAPSNELERNLLAKNDHLAADNRSWLQEREIVLFNLIGSPGAGKTALLESTIPRLAQDHRVFVLEGDQATDLDAQRIQQVGCDVLQINTGAGCHLDAAMISRALRELTLPRGSVVFVENVGNLVCPALFDLGERAKVVVMSVTEGEDKPLKNPHVFRAAALVVLTKVDLLPHVNFDVPRALANARSINPRIETITVAAQRGSGLKTWCNWISAAVAEPLPKVVPA